MESSEHNRANISGRVCLLDVALFRISSQIPYFHKLTPYSYHISFPTIPPPLQLIRSTATTAKCTLHSVLFYLVFEGKFQVQAPWGLIFEGRFNGGFFALRFWEAYTWRGLISEFYGIGSRAWDCIEVVWGLSRSQGCHFFPFYLVWLYSPSCSM